jgi:hypothetical protein
MAEPPSTSLDLTQPRPIGRILTTALSLYRRYPIALLVVALAVMGPYELIVLAVTNTAPLQRTSNANATIIPALVALALVGPLVSALYAKTLAAIGDGERPSIRKIALRGLKALPVVAAAQIVAGIAIGIGFILTIYTGFILFLIPSVILAIRFAVVPQVAAIEQTDWPGALKRSGLLTSRNYLRIFGLLACVYAVNLTLAGVGTAVAGGSASAPDVAAGVVVATLTQSFTALTTALLYFDLRVRQTIVA